MNKILKFGIPIVAVLIFALIYFIVIPNNNKDIVKEFFTDFENSLTNLKIDYVKKEIDPSQYSALKANEYISGDVKVTVYIYGKDSEVYNQGEKDGFIKSSVNAESMLYGFIKNNCVLYMENGFPYDFEILNLFATISERYANELQKK